MRRSRLEVHLDILLVLARGTPLKLTHIMQKADLNCNVLKECLLFLVSQGLVEKRVTAKHHSVFEFYALTKKGLSVLGYFREINQILPVLEQL
jgi:predicted transcriptional regulator